MTSHQRITGGPRSRVARSLAGARRGVLDAAPVALGQVELGRAERGGGGVRGRVGVRPARHHADADPGRGSGEQRGGGGGAHPARRRAPGEAGAADAFGSGSRTCAITRPEKPGGGGAAGGGSRALQVRSRRCQAAASSGSLPIRSRSARASSGSSSPWRRRISSGSVRLVIVFLSLDETPGGSASCASLQAAHGADAAGFRRPRR